MDLCFTKKQILSLLEQDATADPAAQAPTAGTSDKQAGGQGYPEVGKWESGIERGPANQVGVTKWADVVGSKLKRGKANQLKEQVPDSRFGLERWGYNPNKPETLDVAVAKERQFRKDINPHDVLSVLELATIFIPVVGPLVSAGFGLGNAALYYKEGDTKSAGLFALFSVLPFVGDIPIVKQLGKKGMDLLGQKLIKQGTKATLTPLEDNVLKELNKNKILIKSELNNKVKQMAINSLKTTKGLSVNTKKNLIAISKFGLQSAAYLGTGVAYSKTYDYFDKKNQEKDFLNSLLKVRPMKDTTDLTPLDIELANRN